MPVNPLYFEYTEKTIVPDVMYKAPYEQIEKGNLLEAEILAKNKSVLNTLESLLQLNTLPDDIPELEKSNDEYRLRIDDVVGQLNKGEISSSSVQKQIGSLARDLYDDMSSGARSTMNARFNYVNTSIKGNAELATTNPELYQGVTNMSKNIIQSTTDKNEMLKAASFIGTSQPDYNINDLKEWAILTEIKKRTDVGQILDDGTIKRMKGTSGAWLYEITTRGTDEELRELARSYINGSPQFAPYMQTVNYAKDGDLNNLKSDYYDESGKVIDVFDSKHPLYHTATALFNSLRQESYKMDVNQYSLINMQQRYNKENTPIVGNNNNIFPPLGGVRISHFPPQNSLLNRVVFGLAPYPNNENGKNDTSDEGRVSSIM